MRIKVYENVLTKRQCNAIIKASPFAMSTNIPDGQIYDVDFYTTDPENSVFAPLTSAFKKYSDEYNPELRRTFINVMRYVDGIGKITLHQDSNDPDPEIPRTNFTIMIYLNDNFENGETVFFENGEELVVVPQTGKLVIIPGDIDHEARIPVGGNKYIALARYVVK
jgi:hypothetical protein